MQVLTYRVWYPSIEALLPAQNLVASCQLVEALDIGVVSTAYLGVVARLPRLRRLHLCVEPEHQGQALAFPSMPRLTRLQLGIRPCEHGAYDGDDEDAWFHYFGAATLGALPAMEELAITAGVHNRHSRRGTPVDLRTAGSMPRLRQLTLLARAAPAALDFRMLPALRSLRLWAPREVTGAESVGESLELQVSASIHPVWTDTKPTPGALAGCRVPLQQLPCSLSQSGRLARCPGCRLSSWASERRQTWTSSFWSAPGWHACCTRSRPLCAPSPSAGGGAQARRPRWARPQTSRRVTLRASDLRCNNAPPGARSVHPAALDASGTAWHSGGTLPGPARRLAEFSAGAGADP